MKGSQETLAKVWRSRNRIDEIENGCQGILLPQDQ